MMQSDALRQIDRLAQALVRWRHGVALTGAGLSVDSGIPDFRSPGGLWERFDPLEYATIDAFREDPERVWRMLVELDQLLGAARPNPGHLALARLEERGLLDGIVTQNVDNLHQAAGSKTVVEFHGNGRRLCCLRCRRSVEADQARGLGMPPRCPACQNVLKPDVVFFGEAIPDHAMQASLELLRSCKVMIVVATSGTVAPASLMPMIAKQQGAFVAEINLGPTELSAACDVTVHASASESLPALVERVDQILGGSAS